MDEPTPPLPVRAIRKRPQKLPMAPAAQRGLFLLGGILVGGIIVFGFVKLTDHPDQIAWKSGMTLPQPGPEVTYPAPTQPNSDLKTVQPKTGGDDTIKPPDATSPAAAAAVGKAGATTPTGPGTKPTPAGAPPYNPFAGSGVMPDKEISGHISAEPPPGMPSVVPQGKPGAKPVGPDLETAAPRGLLITVRMDVSDPAAAVRALQSIASRAGGTGIRYDEAAAKEDAEGAILFVPAAKAEEAQKLLASVGSVVVSDSWNGSSADRLDRIESAAQDRLISLHDQRQELLIKYFDDAPQIKHIDEDSQRINKSLGALRSHHPGPNIAVLKIKFLS